MGSTLHPARLAPLCFAPTDTDVTTAAVVTARYVHACAGTFEYQSKYPVRSEADLLALCDKHPEGLLLADLKDSYKGVMDDIRVRVRRPLTPPPAAIRPRSRASRLPALCRSGNFPPSE